MLKRILSMLLALALFAVAAPPVRAAEPPPSAAATKPETPPVAEPPKLDSGNTAWMLVHRPRHAYGARPGAVLRRHGAAKNCWAR